MQRTAALSFGVPFQAHHAFPARAFSPDWPPLHNQWNGFVPEIFEGHLRSDRQNARCSEPAQSTSWKGQLGLMLAVLYNSETVTGLPSRAASRQDAHRPGWG